MCLLNMEYRRSFAAPDYSSTAANPSERSIDICYSKIVLNEYSLRPRIFSCIFSVSDIDITFSISLLRTICVFPG